MSISVKTLESSEYPQWDSFVDISPQGDVFSYSWWLDAITKSQFKILAVIENGEIAAGIPITYDSENRINQPPVTRTLGILFKPQLNLHEYNQTSKQRKWLNILLDEIPLDNFVQVCMHHNFTDWLPFRWRGFKQTTRYTYLIYYENKTIDDLWKKLNRGRKETINRAIKNGIRIEKTEDFKLLYKFETLSYERQGLNFRLNYNDLKLLDDANCKAGNRIIFKAIDKSDQVHAMLYIAFNKRSAYALLSGGDAKIRKLGGHTLVMWEAIKFFHDKVEYFNFGGSDIERIEGHLRGFGGELTPYFLIYNEKLLDKRDDIYYHLGEILFHLRGVWKSFKNKISGTFHIK
jgi:hypothetical protein